MTFLRARTSRSPFATAIFLLVVICCLSQNCQHVDAQTPDQGFELLKARIHAVVETTLTKHINPATRQQMYLSAAKAVLINDGKIPPQDLANQFSQANNTEQLDNLLLKSWETSNAKGPATERMTAALTAAVRAASPRSRYAVASTVDHVTKQLSENQYVGIGIVIRQTDGFVEIIEPLIGGPAHKAGAQEGDLIISVDGESCKGKAFGKVLTELRGPKDSSLVIEVEHKDTKVKRTLEMVRVVVPIPSITGVSRNQDGSFELALPADKNIAYLKFSNFVGSTAAELNEFALQLENESCRGAIFDFRGGNNDAATDIHHATMLADVVSARKKLATMISDKGESIIRSNSQSLLKNIPIAVLADANVSGTTMLVLSGLANRENTFFVGPPIYSNLLCYRRQVLPNELGAIENFPFAYCRPELTTFQTEHADNEPDDETHSNSILNPFTPIIVPEITPTRRYQVQSTSDTDPAIRLAVEALQDKIKFDVKSTKS